MGCDIHGWIEVREGDHWFGNKDLTAGAYWVERHYGIFGRLFGVRAYDGVEAVAADRGMPADASAESRAGYVDWGDDAHSATWITAAELVDVSDIMPTSERWEHALDHMRTLGATHGGENVRMVVWFDN